MRKWLWFCILTLFICGCSSQDKSEKDFRYTYNSFVDSILDNNGADSIDVPFRHQLEVTKESSGEYRYAITVDEPHIAMYHIQMMAVDKAASGQYPFIGLMQDEPSYNMIPNQENKEKYFVKGIILEGSSATPKFTLYVQVTWKDYSQINTRTAFFSYTYDYDKEQAKAQAEDTHEADE